MHLEVIHWPQTSDILQSVIPMLCTLKWYSDIGQVIYWRQLLVCHATWSDTVTSDKWYIAVSYSYVMHLEVIHWPQTSDILQSVIPMSCTLKWYIDLRQVIYCSQLLLCHAPWSDTLTSDNWYIAVSYCHVIHLEVIQWPQTSNILQSWSTITRAWRTSSRTKPSARSPSSSNNRPWVSPWGRGPWPTLSTTTPVPSTQLFSLLTFPRRWCD